MLTRLRRPAVALLATTLTSTLAAGVLVSTPATAVATTSIAGTVTHGVEPLEEMQVDVYSYNTEYESWQLVASASTGPTGGYAIDVFPGKYRVGFHDQSGVYAGEYFDDVRSIDGAATLDVAEGETVDADADLRLAGHVTGTVTGPAGPLTGVRVYAYEIVSTSPYLDYEEADAVLTDEEGHYDLGGLVGGTYRVKFDDGWYGDATSTFATEWYDDKPTIDSARDLVVGAGQIVKDVDAVLAPDVQISGRLTDASGVGVSEGGVEALAQVGGQWQPVGYAFTDEDGTYVLDGLPAGTYRARFWGLVGDDRVDEYWKNRGRLENATDITVSAGGAAAGIDAELVPGEHDAENTLANTSLPTISGAPVVGTTLSATAGQWSPTPTDVDYYWLRNGEFIYEFGPTYTVTAADLGARISVRVVAGAETYLYGVADSAPTAPVTTPTVAPPAPTPTPVVTPAAALTAILKGLDVKGAPKVGSTVRLTGLNASFRTAVKYKLQWYAGSKAIKKATKSRLKITSAMRGRKISVKVTATAAGAKVTKKLILGKAR